MVKSGGCLIFCQRHPGPQISVWRFFISYCELRETSSRFRQVSIALKFQSSCVRLSCNMSREVFVLLITVTCRSGRISLSIFRALLSFGFSIAHSCFSCFFGCFRHANPNLRPQIFWSGGCLDLCQAPREPQIPWRRFSHLRT